MIVVHAIWADAKLYLWGEQCAIERPDQAASKAPVAKREHREMQAIAQADVESASGTHASVELSGPVRSAVLSKAGSTGGVDQREDQPSLYEAAVSCEHLRRSLGDVYDSLLVSVGETSELTLRLPHAAGRPVSSLRKSAPPADLTETAEPAAQPAVEPADTVSLIARRVPALCFPAADAVDLLSALPTVVRDQVEIGTSLLYWSHVAGLVLELLAGQHFVPAIHDASGDRYRGYWRVMVDSAETSKRLSSLIAAMPPVCRSWADGQESVEASTLVDNFLWSTVDALVRRCLEGDELAHVLHGQPDSSCPPKVHWLRSLVGAEGKLSGTPEERRKTYEVVRGWLSKLEPASQDRVTRTCFRLHAPQSSGESDQAESSEWRLTLHVQATHDPDLILDADRLSDDRGDDPAILKRPFDQAREQTRADVAHAATHFPPLLRCLESSGPLSCTLTLEEAYSFLREAAPILESEGFGVWLPDWWKDDRAKLRVWLEMKPADASAPTDVSEMGLDVLVSYDWRLAVGDSSLTSLELSELAQAKQPLVRLRGKWVEVQSQDLQAAVRFVGENRGGSMTVLEALRQCSMADDLETGLPVVGLRAQGWIDKLINSARFAEEVERSEPPAGFQGTLRPYQLRGAAWMSFLTRLGLGQCLADDMGLGKTIQLIALWLREREAGTSPGPTLLVVPMSLVGNWQREIERFAPSLSVMVHHGMERLSGQEFVDAVKTSDVVISTYGLIHRDLEHLAAIAWYRVALDEAQNIKNPAAKQSVAVRLLQTKNRVALTGTPVENRLAELWSIMDFLNAGYLGTATSFRRRFAVPIERFHDTDRGQRLRHLIRPFVLRRKKNDPSIEVDLPAKMEMKVFCNLTAEQAALYESVVGDMLGQVDRAGGIQRRGLILAALVRLKQICNHPAQYLGDGSSLPHRSGKCDRVTEMLEEVVAEGDCALVFTQFRVMAELLAKHLHESLQREVLLLHGGTPRKKRDEIVCRFQDESDSVPLLILSLKAGGYGLNLTAASHVFHYDRWWNPAVEDQATDRAHRIGQDKRVQVHKFVCIGTLEEQIDGILERKRVLAENIVGSGEDWITELSTDKLRKLITLSRDAVAED